MDVKTPADRAGLRRANRATVRLARIGVGPHFRTGGKTLSQT